MRTRNWMTRLIATSFLVMTSLASTNPVHADEPTHCAVFLAPVSEDPDTGAVEVDEVDIGCFDTYAEAVEAGTNGATALPSDETPASVTQRTVALTTEAEPDSDVLIGTEYIETSFSSSSKSYFAEETCSAGTTFEESYVGNMWNDDFESGKGFGGCDTNKKFAASNFGGDSLTCTPNCSNYGDLKNLVSSLRWKP